MRIPKTKIFLDMHVTGLSYECLTINFSIHTIRSITTSTSPNHFGRRRSNIAKVLKASNTGNNVKEIYSSLFAFCVPVKRINRMW